MEFLEEVMFEVCCLLSGADLSRLSQCSMQLHLTARNPQLWRAQNEITFTDDYQPDLLSPCELRNEQRLYRSLSRSRMQWQKWVHPKALLSIPRLEYGEIYILKDSLVVVDTCNGNRHVVLSGEWLCPIVVGHPSKPIHLFSTEFDRWAYIVRTGDQTSYLILWTAVEFTASSPVIDSCNKVLTGYHWTTPMEVYLCFEGPVVQIWNIANFPHVDCTTLPLPPLQEPLSSSPRVFAVVDTCWLDVGYDILVIDCRTGLRVSQMESAMRSAGLEVASRVVRGVTTDSRATLVFSNALTETVQLLSFNWNSDDDIDCNTVIVRTLQARLYHDRCMAVTRNRFVLGFQKDRLRNDDTYHFIYEFRTYTLPSLKELSCRRFRTSQFIESTAVDSLTNQITILFKGGAVLQFDFENGRAYRSVSTEVIDLCPIIDRCLPSVQIVDS